MVRLYIDLETYRPSPEKAFIDERIVLVGLIIDETFYSEDSLTTDIEPILLREWNGLDEKKIVTELQRQVRKALQNHGFTVICGYNILRFDIPLLICKSVHYSLGEHEAICQMWNNCFTIDYFQQLLAANNNRFKGLRLENVVKIANKFNLKPPSYELSGGHMKDLYEQEKWKDIEKHNIQDLKIIRWLDLYGAKQLFQISMKERKALFHE